jgi:hypothetical protein
MVGEKKKALTRLPLILLLVTIVVIGLVAYWLNQDYIDSSGRLYPNKSKMCEQFAKSYLHTIKEVEDIDDFGSGAWLRAIDIETEIHKLCQLELTEEAIKNYQFTAFEKYSTNSTDENPVSAFWLVQGDPQYLGVSEQEALEMGKVIATFEGLKHQKNFVEAIKMLTPPQTEMEEWWFNHLSGNDALRVFDSPTPRFLNKVNFHLLVGYDIEKITKEGNVFYAHIKELRVIDLSDDGTDPNPVTDIQDLTFELVNSNGGYQVSRYYHTNPTSLVDLKYEGFVAN